MKRTFLLAVLAVFVYRFSAAQSDTVYHYYSKDSREVSSDSAFTYIKLYKKDDLWYGKEFYKNGKVKSEGNFTDKDAKTPEGSF